MAKKSIDSMTAGGFSAVRMQKAEETKKATTKKPRTAAVKKTGIEPEPDAGKKRTFGFRADEALIDQWKAYVESTGRSFERVCSEAVREYMENHGLTEDQRTIYDMKMKARKRERAKMISIEKKREAVIKMKKAELAKAGKEWIRERVEEEMEKWLEENPVPDEDEDGAIAIERHEEAEEEARERAEEYFSTEWDERVEPEELEDFESGLDDLEVEKFYSKL